MKRSNVGLAALLALVLVIVLVGYRFTQFGQVRQPAAGEAVQADQKPPNAYNARPQTTP